MAECTDGGCRPRPVAHFRPLARFIVLWHSSRSSTQHSSRFGSRLAMALVTLQHSSHCSTRRTAALDTAKGPQQPRPLEWSGGQFNCRERPWADGPKPPWQRCEGGCRMLRLAGKPPKVRQAGRRKSRSSMPRLCQNWLCSASASVAIGGAFRRGISLIRLRSSEQTLQPAGPGPQFR